MSVIACFPSPGALFNSASLDVWFLPHLCNVGRIKKMEARMWAVCLLVECVRCVYVWVLMSLHHGVCPLVSCIHSFDVWFVSMCEAWPVFLCCCC